MPMALTQDLWPVAYALIELAESVTSESVPEVETSTVRELVREEMVAAYDLDPPLAVDAGIGDTWLEAKE